MVPSPSVERGLRKGTMRRLQIKNWPHLYQTIRRRLYRLMGFSNRRRRGSDGRQSPTTRLRQRTCELFCRTFADQGKETIKKYIIVRPRLNVGYVADTLSEEIRRDSTNLRSRKKEVHSANA